MVSCQIGIAGRDFLQAKHVEIGQAAHVCHDAVQIDADANAEAMRSALQIVVSVADAEELEQTGKDDY